MIATRQWLVAILAVLGAFFVAGIAGAFATSKLGFWGIPGAGFCAAFAVVTAAYISAPHHRFQFSACVFVVGAVVAWQFLEPSSYPESYGSLAYQSTHLPLLTTCIGGILALAAVGLLRLKSGPNQSLKRTGLRPAA